MTWRPKNKASVAPRRRSQRGRAPEPWPDAGESLIALARAWTVTTIATALLFVALAIAPLWDSAIFMQALRQSANNGPAVGQSAGETAAW